MEGDINMLIPQKEYLLKDLKINQYLLTVSNPNNIELPSRGLRRLSGITIHNTDWISVSSTTTPAEQYTRATVNGNMGDVRVHFYVDDASIWQNLPLDLSSWHAADGNGRGNMETISIECIMRNSVDAQSLKSEDLTAKLAAALLVSNNLTINELYTHTHWLNVRDGKIGNTDTLNQMRHPYKMCPLYILPHWNNFKSKVKSYMEFYSGKNVETIESQPNTEELFKVRKTWEDAKSQIGAFSSFSNAAKVATNGYYVFNSEGEKLTENTQNSFNQIPSITYQVNSQNRWLGEITDMQNDNDNGYAGIIGSPISLIRIKSPVEVKYRVRTQGRWLPWVSGYNINDFNNGYAGINGSPIDAIQIDSIDKNYKIVYRVSTLNGPYLPFVQNYNEVNGDGYAGVFTKAIDRIQIRVERV